MVHYYHYNSLERALSWFKKTKDRELRVEKRYYFELNYRDRPITNIIGAIVYFRE